MKILRPIIGAAGIFFPIGKLEDGGTCEYSTPKCLKNCYALDKSYDEVVNIHEKIKKDIYAFFVKRSVLVICGQIIQEMEELRAEVLSWFSSGDCLDQDVNRMYQIMELLHGEGIVQNGFTRNQSLYKRIIDGGIIKHFALTLESLKQSRRQRYTFPAGLWAIPNYKTGVVKLYRGKLGKEAYSSCSSHEVATQFKGEEVKIACNCTACYHKKLGCFYTGK